MTRVRLGIKKSNMIRTIQRRKSTTRRQRRRLSKHEISPRRNKKIEISSRIAKPLLLFFSVDKAQSRVRLSSKPFFRLFVVFYSIPLCAMLNCHHIPHRQDHKTRRTLEHTQKNSYATTTIIIELSGALLRVRGRLASIIQRIQEKYRRNFIDLCRIHW